jgi:hypothetical protein
MEDWNPLSAEKENSKRKRPGEERIIRGRTLLQNPAPGLRPELA